MPRRSLGHRAPLLWVVLPLIVGLVVARATGVVGGGVLVAALVAAATSAFASIRPAPPWLWQAATALAFGCAGIASFHLHQRRPDSWDTLPPREFRAALRVDRLFASSDPGRASGIGRLVRVESPFAELTGQRIYFSTRLRPGEQVPRRDAIVSLAGVLTAVPRHPATESFDAYLASSGVNFRLTRARWLRQEQPARRYYRFCTAAAERFKVILGEGIDAKRPTLAGLLRAMMLGETRELTEEQHTLFMQSGTMHLFAISGLNIGAIATALNALLMLARVPAWGRFIIATPLLWLFVDITGAAPSAVRAFAMAFFFQIAFVVRRPANALASVTASASVVLLASPLQLFSASFQMSYGIVLALLVLGLPLAERWLELTRWWSSIPPATWSWAQRRADEARRGIVPTLAIGVATLPVSLITSVLYFQLLTPGSLFANLLLIPAAVLVTIGGFVALLCGLCGFAGGASLCNHASALVLWLIEGLVRLSVQAPGAFAAARFRTAWLGSAALTILVAALCFGYATHWRQERGGWWPPFVIVGLALALGVRFG